MGAVKGDPIMHSTWAGPTLSFACANLHENAIRVELVWVWAWAWVKIGQNPQTSINHGDSNHMICSPKPPFISDIDVDLNVWC